MSRAFPASRIYIVLAFALAGVAALVWALGDGFLGEAQTGLLRPDTPAVVAKGEILYLENCASCHGADLKGQADWRSPDADGRMPAPPHDETGHTWHHADELLFDITKFGVAKAAGLKDYASSMPAYEQILGDEDIIAILSWIKSRWPADIRERHDLLNRQQAGRS